MLFEQALAHLRTSSIARVARRAWSWKVGASYAFIEKADAHSPFADDILCLYNPNEGLHPWVPTQADLFAQDWLVVDCSIDLRPAGPR